MMHRLGLRVASRTAKPSLRSLTTKTTITDQFTGETIKLTDPRNPQYGDYPNPEPEFAQFRDPYQKYDFQQMRRNNNEPLNMDQDLYDMWSPDYYQFVSDKTALTQFATFLAAFFGIGIAVAYFELNPEKPAMPRSYPYNGLAKSLGSSDDASDDFYRVRADLTADASGTLADDEELAAQKSAYLSAHQDFFKS